MDFNTLPSFNLNPVFSDRTDGQASEETIKITKSSFLVRKTGRERLAEDATQPRQDWNPEPSSCGISHSQWALMGVGGWRWEKGLRAAADTGLEGEATV